MEKKTISYPPLLVQIPIEAQIPVKTSRLFSHWLLWGSVHSERSCTINWMFLFWDPQHSPPTHAETAACSLTLWDGKEKMMTFFFLCLFVGKLDVMQHEAIEISGNRKQMLGEPCSNSRWCFNGHRSVCLWRSSEGCLAHQWTCNPRRLLTFLFPDHSENLE